MILFLDTEFSSLPSGELLSIALLPLQRGDVPYFYYENADNNPNMRSAWVQENVIPLLLGKGHSISKVGIQKHLIDYLNDFGEDFTILADYVHDFALFRDLVHYEDEDHIKDFNFKCAFRSHAFYDIAVEQGYSSYKMIEQALTKYPEYQVEYFKAMDIKPHNAFNDVLAQRYAWENSFEWLKSRTL